ncbi:MAG TPA: DJ-1/PfpI family protein [Puia sp.]|nr:DJ-1/PfpI family protein [Puia sp.]
MVQKRKIVFFIPDKVHVLDLSGPVQVFYEANCYGAAYELSYCSLEKQITSSAGLSFGAAQSYADMHLRAGDFIFLPGADMEYLRSHLFKSQKKFFEWLIKNHRIGVNICTICTGAFILAQAGLLNSKTCTTHWKRIEELKKTYPALQIKKDVLYVHEDNIYTSAGITSGIDLSLAIVEEHYGPLFANKISRELLVYYRRGPDHTQQSVYLSYRNHIHTGIHHVQDWLIENLEKKSTIAKLSSIANMGERNLTRVFKKATGLTINQYTKALRLEKLKTLLSSTDLKSDALAKKIGYRNTRQLRRIKNSSIIL